MQSILKALFDLEAAEVILKRVLKWQPANTTAMDMLAEACPKVFDLAYLCISKHD